MKFLPCFFILFLVSIISNAQKFSTLADLINITEKSKLKYIFTNTPREYNLANRTSNLNLNNVYLEDSSGSIVIKVYDINAETKKLTEEAEILFRDGDIKKARSKYLKILEDNPKYYMIMWNIAQTFESEGATKKAKIWYEKAIESNYIDYMAHWFYANLLYNEGEYSKACEEITMAWILNRNNDMIKNKAKEIYRKNKLNFIDWYFNPEIEIYDKGVIVNVFYNELWYGYAINKAIWKFEPNYAKSKGDDPLKKSTFEERECLMNLLVGLKLNENIEIEDISIKNLIKASDNNYIDEYIIFEIWLPDYPFLIYQLQTSTLKRISDYILNIRSKR